MNKISEWMLSSVLVLGLVFSACAAPPKPAPAPAPERSVSERPAPATPQLTSQQQLIEAAKKEGEVVLWTFSFRKPEGLIRTFEEKYPFLKWKHWDADGPEIINKTVEEAKIGKYSADVLHLPSIELLTLAQQGFLKEYEWPNVKGWKFQPDGNLWRNLTAAIRSPIYNTDLVPAAEAPKSWEDLKNTKWRGKSVAGLGARNFPLQTAWLWGDGKKLEWEKSEAFWTEVVKNTAPRVMSGFTGPTELLAAGEFSLLIVGSLNTYLDFFMRGAPVRLANVGRTTGSTHAIMLLKNAPHPNAAKLLVDFMTSEEGLLLFANQQGSPALSPQVAKRALADRMLAQAGVDYVLMPDELQSVENQERSAKFWNTLLGRR